MLFSNDVDKIEIPNDNKISNLDNLITNAHEFIDEMAESPIIFIFDNLDKLIESSKQGVRQFIAFVQLVETHKKRDIQIIVSLSNRKMMLSLIDFTIFTPVLLFTNSEIQISFGVGELYK